MVTVSDRKLSKPLGEKLEVVDFHTDFPGDQMQTATTRNTQDNQFLGHRVHFIGIGGSGMCGLAQMLAQMGAVVSGSDRTATAATEKLSKLGVQIAYQQTSDSFPHEAQYVVYSADGTGNTSLTFQARQPGFRQL